MKISYKINQPLPIVFDHLTDVEKFVSVHPVIYKIERLAENKLLVYERLKFGFITYSFTYTATIVGDTESHSVEMFATVMKINKIKMTFKIIPGDGFTLVEEEVNFKTFFPIKGMMENIFRKQHAQLFRNIANAK